MTSDPLVPNAHRPYTLSLAGCRALFGFRVHVMPLTHYLSEVEPFLDRHDDYISLRARSGSGCVLLFLDLPDAVHDCVIQRFPSASSTSGSAPGTQCIFNQPHQRSTSGRWLNRAGHPRSTFKDGRPGAFSRECDENLTLRSGSHPLIAIASRPGEMHRACKKRGVFSRSELIDLYGDGGPKTAL